MINTNKCNADICPLCDKTMDYGIKVIKVRLKKSVTYYHKECYWNMKKEVKANGS